MADKPHRAVVIYGDGLVYDFQADAQLNDATKTSIEAARIPTLDEFALHGTSGFLALRELPSEAPHSKRLVWELSQLLDISANIRLKETAGRSEPVQLPSLAERFMNLGAMMITNTSEAATIGKNAGFSVFSFSDMAASLGSTQALANRIVEKLGLDQIEDKKAPPPSAAERSNDEFELAFVHVTPNDFLEPLQGGTPESSEGVGTLGGPVTAAAVRGLEWVDSLVKELREWETKSDLKSASHLFLIVLLGYGDEGASEFRGIESPGVAALKPNIDKSLSILRPRQSYTLKEDKEVRDVRNHHPLLAIYHLNSVTRQDDAQKVGIIECKERGGNLTILADRFLHEITFKLWRSPKYGA